MAIPAQQIGWDQKSKLLWNISKQLEQLIKVSSKVSPGIPATSTTTTTTTTALPINTSFIATFIVSNDGDSITLPYNPAGTYTGTIDWGDGNTTSNSYANQSHQYTTAGTYTITIDGAISDFSFGVYGGTNTSLMDILQWGTQFRFGNSGMYFFNCGQLMTLSAIDVPNLTGTTNMARAFQGSSFNASINAWDMSGVTNMSQMFADANYFNQPLNYWDVSNVTDMNAMFRGSLTFNQPINSWNVSNVVDMNTMFAYSNMFNQPLNSWNTLSVTDMSYMFNQCVFNQDISSWNVANVTNMISMLSNSTQFSTTNLDAIYNSWSALPSLQTGVNFEAYPCYDSSASAGRAILTDTYGWIITDGGVC